MDPYEEYKMYENLSEQMDDQVSLSHQRKILHTRMLKLSLPLNNYGYGIIRTELLESGQLQKSIVWLKRATIVSSFDISAQISLAKALFKVEKENEAFSSLKKALSLNPHSSDLHKFLFEALEEKNRLEDFESFFKEILNMIADPRSIPIFYLISGEALVNSGKYSQAIVKFRKAMEMNPPKTYNGPYKYGMALYYEGLFEESIVQFELARRELPWEKSAINNIAFLNYCLGKVPKARKDFEYIFTNGLETHFTYLNFLLVLYYLDESEEVINQYKNRFEQSLGPNGFMNAKFYNDLLRITQARLERDNVDEKAREFNLKKIQGINLVLSFINEKTI